MAHPFGGHPTFQEYLNWLRGKGFNYKTGYIKSPSGKNMFAIWIESPKGETLLSVPGIELDERLAPSMIEKFDRRLEVQSPFATRPRQS